MPTRSAESIGRRIKAAREAAGLTQEDVARRIPLDRSALAKIETGTRKVSALELARIADEVGVRIEWFISDAPPAIVSRRDARGAGSEIPTIERVTERIAREVEFVMSHDARLASLSSPDPLDRPSTRAEIEDAASRARTILGADVDQPLLDIARRFQTVGLLCFSFDLGVDAADGSALLLERGGVAVVNGHLHVGRRRLTLAHEFGHFMFADEFTVDWQVSGSDEHDARESTIDRFARALLLPASGLTAAWREHQANERTLRESAVITASEFRVDMSTLARRLSELGLASEVEAARVRNVRTRRADIVDFDLLVHHELEPPELPRAYIEAVLRLYRQEVISSARAVDLLFDTWDEADLPDLPPLPEQSIWSLAF